MTSQQAELHRELYWDVTKCCLCLNGLCKGVMWNDGHLCSDADAAVMHRECMQGSSCFEYTGMSRQVCLIGV